MSARIIQIKWKYVPKKHNKQTKKKGNGNLCAR